MVESDNKFPPMESEINYAATNFGAALAWIAIALLASLVAFPIYELADYGFIDYMANRTGRFFALLLMEILCIGGSFFVTSYLLSAKKNNKYTVLVNDRALLSIHRTVALQRSFFTRSCAGQMTIHLAT